MCRDKHRKIFFLDCGLNANLELLFVYLVSLNLSGCLFCILEQHPGVAFGVRTGTGQSLAELPP